LGGASVIELYVPICAGMALTFAGLSVLPTALSTSRERGVLRRMSTTPVPPGRLLAIAALLTVARAAFGVALPRQLIGYLLAFVLAAGAVFALGLAVAAVAPNGKAGGAIGNMLFFPLMFFGGLWVPREAMGHTLRRIGDYTPLGAGVQALRDASAGHWPHPLHLAV